MNTFRNHHFQSDSIIVIECTNCHRNANHWLQVNAYWHGSLIVIRHYWVIVPMCEHYEVHNNETVRVSKVQYPWVNAKCNMRNDTIFRTISSIYGSVSTCTSQSFSVLYTSCHREVYSTNTTFDEQYNALQAAHDLIPST